MDDSNMPKQLQQILVHTFREIDLHHLSTFVHLFAKLFHGDMHMDDCNMPTKFGRISLHIFR